MNRPSSVTTAPTNTTPAPNSSSASLSPVASMRAVHLPRSTSRAEVWHVPGGLDVVLGDAARVSLIDDDKDNTRKNPTLPDRRGSGERRPTDTQSFSDLRTRKSTGLGGRRFKHPAQPSVPACCPATAMARVAIAPIARRRRVAKNHPEPGIRGSKVPVQTSLAPPSTESR
jgi:hypothetical protein